MLAKATVELECDYFTLPESYIKSYDYVIYSGSVDEYFKYKYGILNYRSLKFKREIMDVVDFQGTAVVNYTDGTVPWTRIIEHKHFDMNFSSSKTVIYKEYPDEWTIDKIRFYPVNDENNNKLFDKYREEMSLESKVSFGGRLGDFKYYDMHQVIGSALQFCEKFS